MASLTDMFKTLETAARIRAQQARGEAERLRTEGFGVLDMQRPRPESEREGMIARHERAAQAWDARAKHLAAGTFPLEPVPPDDWSNMTQAARSLAMASGVAVVDVTIPPHESDSSQAIWTGRS